MKFSGIAKLISGSFLSQLLVIVASPVLTRLYSVESFGYLSIFNSLVGIFGSIACLRYEQAIVVAKDDDDAYAIGVACCFVSLCFSFVLFFSMLGVSSMQVMTQVKLKLGMILLISINIFINGAYLALQYLALRKKDFSYIAKRQLLYTIVLIACQLVFSQLYSSDGIGLILGMVVSQGVAVIVYLPYFSVRIGGFHKLKRHAVKKVLSEYWRYPLFDVWSSLLNITSLMLPSLLLARSYSVQSAGYYSLAFRLLSLPSLIVGNSLSQVFLASAKDALQTHTLMGEAISIIKKTSIVALLILLFTFFYPMLFKLFFGHEWVLSGYFARVITPWICAQLIAAPLSAIPILLRKQRWVLLFQVILFAMRAIVFVIFAGKFSDMFVMKIYSLSSMVAYIIFSLYCLRFAKISDAI